MSGAKAAGPLSAANRRLCMIAYFILVHRYPEQFKRLFRAIYVPGQFYVVHVDKSAGKPLQDDIAAFLAPYQGAAMLPARRAMWGGYSLVDAELRGMAKLLSMSADWKYYINLSGQDFPLKSQAYIRDFLMAHNGQQFIRAVNQRRVRPDTMNRISHVFIEALGHIVRTGLPRPFMAGVTPYIGTQWKAVSRQFCDYVCNDERASRFKRFYRHSFIADEAFFQTVMLNSPSFGRMMNDDLRMIDWVPDGDIKLRPRNFGTPDAARLRASHDLFARKFDSQEDPEILGLLEQHLASPAARFFDQQPRMQGPAQFVAA